MFYHKINHHRRVKGRLVWNKREVMEVVDKEVTRSDGQDGNKHRCVCIRFDRDASFIYFIFPAV